MVSPMSRVNSLVSADIGNYLTNKETWSSILFNVKVYGAEGDGTTDDAADISAAITAASVNGGIVMFPPGTYKVSSAITSPSNVTLWFANGAKLSVDSGVTVTINGSIDAELHEIFSGSGTVTIGKRALYIIPHWFGAVGDNTNDDKAAIQKALDVVNPSGGTVYMPPGNYKITSSLRIYGNNVAFIGAGQGSTTITNHSTVNDSITLADTFLKESITISDMTITANTTTIGYGINYVNVHRSHLDNVQIRNHKFPIRFGADNFDIYCRGLNILNVGANGSGILIVCGANGGGIWITDATIDCSSASSSYGIDIQSGSGIYFKDIDIRNAGNEGMIIRPNTGQTVLWCWFYNVSGDTSGGQGIYIAPNGTGVVNSLEFHNCWGSTNSGNGVAIDTGGTVDGVEFIGLRCLDNVFDGLNILGGINISVIGGVFAGNSAASSGSNNGIKVAAGVSKFKIQDVRSGQSSGRANTQAYGITVLTGASDNYMITGNDLTNNVTGGLNDAGTGLNKVVANNLS